MFDCINQVLDFIIKSSIVLGLVLVVIFYTKIEKYEKEFEKGRNERRGQAIVEEIINRQIAELEKTKNEKVAPLERERQRLLSKIPFLK